MIEHYVCFLRFPGGGDGGKAGSDESLGVVYSLFRVLGTINSFVSFGPFDQFR